MQWICIEADRSQPEYRKQTGTEPHAPGRYGNP
jgi:hypothetical protein